MKVWFWRWLDPFTKFWEDCAWRFLPEFWFLIERGHNVLTCDVTCFWNLLWGLFKWFWFHVICLLIKHNLSGLNHVFWFINLVRFINLHEVLLNFRNPRMTWTHNTYIWILKFHRSIHGRCYLGLKVIAWRWHDVALSNNICSLNDWLFSFISVIIFNPF